MLLWIQKRFIVPLLVSLFAGLAILVYKGPGWLFLRYYVGDVVAVAFLYFTLSLFWKAPVYFRMGAIAFLALSIELAQLVGVTPKNGSIATEIVFGSHFDPGDFLAYIVGLAIAVGIDRWILSMGRSRAD